MTPEQTREQTREAAAAIVERSTRPRGLPRYLENEDALDRLAAAVAEHLFRGGGGGGGPDPPCRPGPRKAPVAPEDPSSPKEKPEHGRP